MVTRDFTLVIRWAESGGRTTPCCCNGVRCASGAGLSSAGVSNLVSSFHCSIMGPIPCARRNSSGSYVETHSTLTYCTCFFLWAGATLQILQTYASMSMSFCSGPGTHSRWYPLQHTSHRAIVSSEYPLQCSHCMCSCHCASSSTVNTDLIG